MNHCSSCGQDSPTSTNFCIKCGAPVAASSPKVFPGRPVISMDPQKQGQTTKYESQPLNQIQNPPTTQVQSAPSPIQMNRNGNQKNKKLVGVVGAVIAIIALVVFWVKRIHHRRMCLQMISNLNLKTHQILQRTLSTTQATMTIRWSIVMRLLIVAPAKAQNMTTVSVCSRIWKRPIR